MDLNLPKKDGFEVLEEIRKDEKLKKMPVVILSTSDSGPDIIKSYEKSANCYVVKPVALDDFISTVKSIEKFWLSVAKLPENN